MFKTLTNWLEEIGAKPSEQELLKRKVKEYLKENWAPLSAVAAGIAFVGFRPTTVIGGSVYILRKRFNS